MADTQEQKIARLMAEGLDHYGHDAVDAAVKCWREVLAMDPRHQVAIDYLDVAGFAPTADGSTDGAAEAPDRPPVALLDTANAYIEAGEWSEAHEALSTHVENSPADLEAQATLDLLRSHLHAAHRQRIGDGTGVPCVAMGPAEILQFNLPANAGFVLSMVDGHTSVSDLIALSGMDPFDALHVFTRLMDVGIVEVRA